jgi:hypothetical protein
MAKYFTIAQANEVVQIIRPLMRQLLEMRASIQKKQPEAWPVVEKAAGNGGNKAASKVALEFEKMETLVKAIQGTGALLKDLNSGLVDFLALRDGREVYLCWRYGEDEIQYWHEIEAGYSGRHPI